MDIDMNRQAAVARVLKQRLLKEYDVDVKDLSVEDLAIENLRLKGTNEELMQKLALLNDKKPKFNFVREVLKTYKFPKLQKKLFKRLASREPVSAEDLRAATGTKNLKSLLRDTNDKFEAYGGKGVVEIKSCYKDLKLRAHYHLVISAPAS